MIIPVVEGQGDVESVGILLRRALRSRMRYDVQVGKPIRAKRNKIVKPGELERILELAANRPGVTAIMVILDADDDCPVELARSLVRRANHVVAHIPVHVVIANREWEAWFLGSAESLAGKRGLRDGLSPPNGPEFVRDAKGWLSENMEDGRKYMTVVDQPAMTEIFDFASAESRCRSFRKLMKEIDSVLN